MTLLKWVIAGVFVVMSAGLFLTATRFARRGSAADATFGVILGLCSLCFAVLVAGAALWGPQ